MAETTEQTLDRLEAEIKRLQEIVDVLVFVKTGEWPKDKP